jgi:hypothetical protein
LQNHRSRKQRRCLKIHRRSGKSATPKHFCKTLPLGLTT